MAELIGKDRKWKPSVFKGDPILGKDSYFYLTKYTNTLEKAFDEIARVKVRLDNAKIPLIREKIEDIVHDIRHINIKVNPDI